MKIIADTNVWYKLGNDEECFKKAMNLPIAPTTVNIIELSRTYNLINKEEYTRNAIRALFHFKKNAILDQPFEYIARLYHNHSEPFNPNILRFLNFTSMFAKGATIDQNKIDDFRKTLDAINSSIQEVVNFYNKQADDIYEKVKEFRKTHRAQETEELIGTYINHLVHVATHEKYKLDGHDSKLIELLISGVDFFFKELETTGMKVQPNDVQDFSILSYVQPGDKFWTFEKRWIRIIKESGRGDYLFTLNGC